jgi:hypothetical protein
MNLIQHIVSAFKLATAKRSPKWPAVERAHLEKQPRCAACDSTKQLNVHHKLPFHLHPELELDPNNLITLCMDNECHIEIGHGGNFKAYNPEVTVQAEQVLIYPNRRDEIIAWAHDHRLFE